MLACYDKPATLTRYPDGGYRVVSNNMISQGENILIPGLHNGGREVVKVVAAVIECRPSRGQFINESDRPWSQIVMIA